jgi:hypothetical protein
MLSIAGCLPLFRLGLEVLELRFMSSHFKLEAYCNSVPSRADLSCPMSALVGNVCLKGSTLHTVLLVAALARGVLPILLLR